jgi:tRNA-5-taurinomethyluridine 2-sulfurtransferase
MKIAVLVSGGVDSSVALRLLKDQGHDVIAFYLKIWLEDELAYLGDCPWQEDLSYVEKVCKQADVPLKVVSLQKEYWDRVVNYTISEIKAGRTPNPDILCNSRVKFGAFLDCIDNSFEKVASGHYAKVQEVDGIFQLQMTPDVIKDQTYFLSHLTQKQLGRLVFPIGHFKKSEVRDLAQDYNLPNKDRKDSQGICFLGKLKFKDFVKHHLGINVGNIIEFETGKILGQHEGFWFHTIGQRQGLGLSGGPWYVVQKDVGKNIIYVSKNYFEVDKIRDSFEVDNINWICKPLDSELKVKLRHGPKLYDCKIQHGDNSVKVKLDENDQGIAPGQFATFYRDNICLGSGIIRKVL